MKIKFFLLSIVLLNCLFALGQSPDWSWAKKAIGSGDEIAKGIVSDASGNVYVTGSFNSDSITFGSMTLTNAGGADIFIVKYDGAGNALWAHAIGGSANDASNSIAIDDTGNVFITGYFVSPSIIFGSVTLTNADPVDVFIAKYNSAGNAQWAKKAGALGNGTANINSSSIATDHSGNIFIAGWFNDQYITFGTNTLTNTTTATYDLFIAKYDGAGNTLWAANPSGTGDDFANSIAVDPITSDVYITGAFSSSILQFDTSTLTNLGSYDVLIAKYSSSGAPLWAHSGSGNGSEEGYGVTVDANGNAFITGYFAGSTISFSGTSISNTGLHNIFVTKYSSAGGVSWTEDLGGNNYDYAQSITINAEGKLILCGGTASASINFGGTIFTNTSGGGVNDLFVAQLEPQSGSVEWAAVTGGTDYDQATKAVGDVFGNTYVTGTFKSSSVPFTSTNLLWAGDVSTYDIFIAKLNTATGIDEAINENTFSIYPNPSDEFAVCNWQFSKLKNQLIKVFDVTGTEIFSSTVSTLNYKLETLNLQNGIYFAQLSSDKRSVTRKLIVQH